MVTQAELRKRNGGSRLESQEKVSVVSKKEAVNVKFMGRLYYVVEKSHLILLTLIPSFTPSFTH